MSLGANGEDALREVAERLEDPRNRPPAGEVPPVTVGREQLSFFAGGRLHHVRLEELTQLGDGAIVPLLLYGMLVKLHDVDCSLRRIASASEKSMERIEGATQASPIIADVIRQMRQAGLMPPEAPIPERRG